MVKLDLGAVWADAMALGRANSAPIVPLAGLFLFLPVAIADQFITPLATVDPGASTEILAERLMAFIQANWIVLFARGIVTSFGSLAILSLLLRPERPTVADAMRQSGIVLPMFILANLVQSLVIGSGFMLFVLPGIYFMGRLMLLSPVAATEGAPHPLMPLMRSVALTQGNGWRIVALIAIIFVVGMVASIVATSITGTFFSLALPNEIAKFAQSLVASLAEVLLAMAILLASAALYRALGTRPVSQLR